MYDLLLRIIYLLLHLPFIGSRNKKTWLLEQKKIFKKLIRNQEKAIWIHCASLGEYEQVKPLIPGLKNINPLIIITFFSPSGYMQFKDYNLINQIYYLPFDFKNKMTRFIDSINPEMVIISKNEIWPNMLSCLENGNIPVFLIGLKCKISKTNNWFHRLYYKRYLQKFRHIFCQDHITYEFLKSKDITNASIVGDIRINQILMDAQAKYNDEKIINFTRNNKKIIIYGSIEKSDYDIIANTIKSRKDVNHIIVPHEINNTIIKELEQLFASSCSIYSKMDHTHTKQNNTLIVDVFGILKQLYQYSHIAYIGGGFDQGVHNTIEPAVHGNYMLFGPKHMDFPETHFFIKNKIAFSINNKQEFEQKSNTMLEEESDTKKHVLEIAKLFFNQKRQDINMIINHIKSISK